MTKTLGAVFCSGILAVVVVSGVSMLLAGEPDSRNSAAHEASSIAAGDEYTADSPTGPVYGGGLPGVCGTGAVLSDLTADCAAGLIEGAVVENGTVRLGVRCEGHLNVGYPTDGCLPLPDAASCDGFPINVVGLRYLPVVPFGGSASTEPGCECEGWGVSDITAGCVASGSANDTFGPPIGLTLISFEASATSAKSVVETTDGKFRVTHEYTPSGATPNLYVVTVGIENLTAADADIRYRRLMDWDIFPKYFSEYSTIIHDPGDVELARTSTNGFDFADPCNFNVAGFQEGPPGMANIVDSGPVDHGALFDFEFLAIPAGSGKTFRTFYGAAGTEADADAARAAESITTYSYGQPDCPDSGNFACVADRDGDPTTQEGCLAGEEGPNLGTPNTYIFGFSGIEGGFCGDGTVDAGEECDDGNNVSGDGCSSICTIEGPPVPMSSRTSLLIFGLALLGVIAVLIVLRARRTTAA